MKPVLLRRMTCTFTYQSLVPFLTSALWFQSENSKHCPESVWLHDDSYCQSSLATRWCQEARSKPGQCCLLTLILAQLNEKIMVPSNSKELLLPGLQTGNEERANKVNRMGFGGNFCLFSPRKLYIVNVGVEHLAQPYFLVTYMFVMYYTWGVFLLGLTGCFTFLKCMLLF